MSSSMTGCTRSSVQTEPQVQAPGPVHIRLATSEDDIMAVAKLWTRSAAWLRRRGSDQWQYPVKWENIRLSVADRTCWIVSDGAEVAVGTITVEPTADPYWTAADKPENALYVHRLVLTEEVRGSELGSALLDWVAQRARAVGRGWVRLDAWKSNKALHRYYLDRGFSLVRIDDNPSDPSGACFQRSASVELNIGPDVIEDM